MKAKPMSERAYIEKDHTQHLKYEESPRIEQISCKIIDILGSFIERYQVTLSLAGLTLFGAFVIYVSWRF